MTKPWDPCTLMRATSIAQRMPTAATRVSRPTARPHGPSHSMIMPRTTTTAGIPDALTFSDDVVHHGWWRRVRVRLHEMPVFARDELTNGAELRSASGRMDVRHPARHCTPCRAAQRAGFAVALCAWPIPHMRTL